MFFRKETVTEKKPEGILPAYMVQPSVIERSELARILVQKGLFDVDDPNNVLFLPAVVELSRKTKVALHAHISEPLAAQDRARTGSPTRPVHRTSANSPMW